MWSKIMCIQIQEYYSFLLFIQSVEPALTFLQFVLLKLHAENALSLFLNKKYMYCSLLYLIMLVDRLPAIWVLKPKSEERLRVCVCVRARGYAYVL